MAPTNHEVACDYFLNNPDSVFYPLTDEEKGGLFNNHVCTIYKKGEIIFREGDKPAGLICLANGKVKIFKEGVGGREQIVRMASPLGFIGYRALFAEQNYSGSAVALEDSVVCILEKESLYKVMRTNANLTMRMMKKMATELGISNTRTVSLTQKHIRGRLAESLLLLVDTYGLEEDKMTIKAYLSREDLANLSNMTTSNAIRTLSTFAGENLIALDGRKISILDMKRLERVSDMG
ncbi:MAG: Crp/Fnr family transcriptional regulator [Bacteroidales bacterium]|nr:Crp/Fnr family transcriptional regulator [Bacteroidales bacterium]